ncbi:XRE family transcriptional regulator [Holdemanella biformis]|uniref:XRE family transcriptional regulator n=1 Tax=Holdemanella biformis TaxID=1735 RepID=UPI001D148345|nr:XRE family transcriptional regulator [Holdemanella biformis]MCC3353768.1 XRE family transcriptional regulator [Holdemanella biformis]
MSTDYLLKDEIEKEKIDTSCDTDCELHRVTMEEANAYMNEKKKAAPMLANATTLCILSLVPLFLVSTLNDGLAIGIACTILLGMVALAVFIFIKTGIKLSPLQYLEQEPFETEYGVTGLVKEKNQSYQEHYSFSLACGVVLCILSVIPLIIAGCMEASDYVCTLCLAVLLILVSIGVNILIRVSTIKSSYDTLLQEGDYTKKEKLVKKKTETFTGVYWCLVTAVYLGWSLWTKQWDVTYMIWPVAAVLYAAMYGIVRMIMKLEK